MSSKDESHSFAERVKPENTEIFCDDGEMMKPIWTRPGQGKAILVDPLESTIM